jgi:hypothetical protein
LSESEGGSVLLSERELGSAPTTSSTIIGKSPSKLGSESDIRLADTPGDAEGSKTGSDVKLAAASDILPAGESSVGVAGGSGVDAAGGSGTSSASGISAVGGSGISLGGSGIGAGSGSGLAREGGSDLGLQFEELDSLELDFGDAEPSKSGSAVQPAADKGDKKSAVAGPGPGDSTLQLADDAGSSSGSGSGSGKRKPGSDVGGSALDLSGDDDLVLGGSGSDVTGKPGDSGIALMDPSDSGLSLDEPLDITGSKVDGGSLVLGEDDMITLGGSAADVSAATQLRSDDDFLLTPSAKAGDESESGSQVIALDSIAGFDDDAATQVGSTARMLEEDISGADTMVGGPMAAGAGMPAMAGAPGMMMAPAVPEAPYSIWNVLAMFVCVAVLCLLGMMMVDLVRNMTSWNGTYTANSGLMDWMIETFFKK